VERLRGIKSLSSALATVTAAVVGVILNLALCFGLHVIFPRSGKVDCFADILGGIKSLSSALATVTAAVVGVILNLALWFGLHVIFPRSGNVDWFAVVVCAVTFVGMLRWKWNIVPVVLGSGLVGLI